MANMIQAMRYPVSETERSEPVFPAIILGIARYDTRHWFNRLFGRILVVTLL